VAVWFCGSLRRPVADNQCFLRVRDMK